MGRVHTGSEMQMFQAFTYSGVTYDSAQWDVFRDYLESASGAELLSEVCNDAQRTTFQRGLAASQPCTWKTLTPQPIPKRIPQHIVRKRK